MESSFCVINLSGASLAGKRWTKKYKSIIQKSRLETTELLVSSISKCINRPATFISASAVGYYGNTSNECKEDSPPGNGFTSEICQKWEAEAANVNQDVRVCTIRTGLVLDKSEGALAKMLPAFRMFVGGPVGSGNQWMSWIHIMIL